MKQDLTLAAGWLIALRAFAHVEAVSRVSGASTKGQANTEAAFFH
jgi:hypothetical protein